ncbi:MAG: DUF3108 domain-containing protein [Polyangia bacterium]
MRLLLALVLGLVAAPAFAVHPGARPGEAFTFKFSLGPVDGGRARMSIGRAVSQKGRRVVAVHGQAETTAFVKLLARMDDDYKLVVDTGNLLPVSVAETERGVRERRINVSNVNPRIADVEFWSPEKQHKGRHLLPRITRDPLSGFFALRALPLAEGGKIDLDVLDGNALWRVVMTVHRGAKIRLENDPTSHAAIRIDGVARRIEDSGRPRAGMGPRNLTVWLSDDGDRVLLRLEADTDLGRCALELTSYVPPTTRVADERSPELPGIETR